MNGEGRTTPLGLPEPGRGLLLVAIATVLACGLVIGYIASGGGDFRPTATADPCKPHPWPQTDGVEEVAEQIAISSLNGAACELGVSREELTRALLTEGSREDFIDSHDIDDAELDSAVRAGLTRGVDEAEGAGAIDSWVATGLRVLVKTIPIDEALSLIQDARPLLERGQSLLDQGSRLFGGGMFEQGRRALDQLDKALQGE